MPNNIRFVIPLDKTKVEKSTKYVCLQKTNPSGSDDGNTFSPLFVIPKTKRTKKKDKMRAKLRFYTSI